MNCPNCETQLAHGDRFCESCGSAVPQPIVKPHQVRAVTATSRPPTADATLKDSPAVSDILRPRLPLKKSRRTQGSIIGGIVAILVVTLARALFFSGHMMKLPGLWLLGQQGPKVLQPTSPIIKVPPALLLEPQNGSRSGRTANANRVSMRTAKPATPEAALRSHDPKILNDTSAAIEAGGDNSRAIQLLAEAHRLAPTDPTIAYNYARGLYLQDKLDQAMEEAEAALRQKPDLVEAKLLLADAAIRKRDYTAAEKQISNLTSASRQTQLLTLAIHGAILLEQGKSKEALAVFQQAVALASDDPQALYNRGVAQQKIGDLAQAEDSYRRALDQDPNFPEAHNNLGTVLAAMGESQAAFDEFHAASLASPDNKMFSANLAASSQDQDSADKIVGTWQVDSGTFNVSGTLAGQQISQVIPMPPGTQIKFDKLADGGYQAQEAAMGVAVKTTFRLQGDGSYQAPAVIPAELARLLPPGITDAGTVSFWVHGETLFGDTLENVTGPGTHLRAQKAWKAKRVAMSSGGRM